MISGSALRALRVMKAMSINDLGRAVGLSGAYICMIEKGKRRVPSKHLRRLLDALGVDLDEALEVERQVQRLNGGETQ